MGESDYKGMTDWAKLLQLLNKGKADSSSSPANFQDATGVGKSRPISQESPRSFPPKKHSESPFLQGPGPLALSSFLANLSPSVRCDFKPGEIVLGEESGTEYKILRSYNGGFGVVYIVERLVGEIDSGPATQKGTIYALKSLQAKFIWDDSIRNRFAREILTWLRLDPHPNIVSMVGMELVESLPCLVLEFVSGGDLAQRLRAGPLAFNVALQLGLQFCSGMEFAHTKLAIVHRDIKPANCMLTEEGLLKITDFGLARAFGAKFDSSTEQNLKSGATEARFTSTAGTPLYMAPEQRQLGVELDTRTDIFSFGIMLYEMMAGGVPWHGGGVSRGDIQKMGIKKGIPKEILGHILQCIERDPADRPKSFSEVRAALEQCHTLITGSPAPPLPTPSVEIPAQDLARKAHTLLIHFDRPEEAMSYCERGLSLLSPKILEPTPIKTSSEKKLNASLKDFAEKALWVVDKISLIETKARALQALGRHSESLVQLDFLLNGPKIIQGRLRVNWILLKLGCLAALDRDQESFAYIEQAIGQLPFESNLWLAKSQLMRDAGKWSDALSCLDRALELAPREWTFWNAKASLLNKLGRHEEALVCLEIALEKFPRNYHLFGNKALILADLGRNEAARVALDTAFEIAPRDAFLWSQKGNFLGAMGRYDEALICLEKSLEISPHFGEVWANRGLTLANLERYEEAIRCFDMGLTLNPHNRDLWSAKCEVLKALDRNEEYMNCCAEAKKNGVDLGIPGL